MGMPYIIGPYLRDTIFYIGPEAAYRIARKCSEKYAKEHNLEVAEGPTLFVAQNGYNDVEVWPLVQEVDSALSG